ncbi:biotin/lipoyl-binding protein [Dickeya oryzae]|uniref:efflux RND transporter periplasmic adaptor subunit n=1 Tax=Dickeya oryzae TaxID=1240404 RepID=UPI001AEC8778|nr:biotin/lipoyl-binding protein [Dickeya oryzae]MBP2844729.1 biotin/lipoyl-binding protein [Dickeya oryzae]
MTVKPPPIILTDDLPGRVTAVRTAEIRPQVGGIIQRRLFEQGAEIRAGQPLFQINPAPFKAGVDIAHATLQRTQSVLNQAQIQVARLKPLLSTGAISQQSYAGSPPLRHGRHRRIQRRGNGRDGTTGGAASPRLHH